MQEMPDRGTNLAVLDGWQLLQTLSKEAAQRAMISSDHQTIDDRVAVVADRNRVSTPWKEILHRLVDLLKGPCKGIARRDRVDLVEQLATFDASKL